MIEIDFDTKKITDELEQTAKEVKDATVYAVNETTKEMRKESVKWLLKKYGVGRRSGTKMAEYLQTNRATPAKVQMNGISAGLQAMVNTKRGLLNYILDNPEITDLKGLEKALRRETKVHQARISRHPKAFVAKDKNGKKQVFKRGNYDGKENEIFRPTTHDPEQMMTQKEIQATFDFMAEATAEEKFRLAAAKAFREYEQHEVYASKKRKA